MTLIKYMSDLHLDMIREPFMDEIPENSKDITLVLAGDICEVHNSKILIKFLQEVCKNYRYVLYLPGNHEFYRNSIIRAMTKLRHQINEDNLIFMDQNTVIIDDVKFIGATLWTDMDNGDPLFYLRADDKHTGLNDYRYIRWGTADFPYSRRFRPRDAFALHLKDLAYIRDNLTYDTRKTVVMTHHAPLISIVNRGKYGNHPLNPAYGSHLEKFVANSFIDLWISGHVHDTTDDDFFGTRIVKNARGYSNRENPAFMPNAIIEL